MTARAPEEPRVKPVRSAWRLPGAWLTGRGVLVLAGGSVLALFAGLWLVLRERPAPRPRAEFPPPPRLGSQILSAQERLKANPQDISSLVDLGTMLFQKGKDSYVEAIGTLEEARDLGALDPRIFYCLGVMYQEEGLYPFALNEYKRFLRHYPDDKEVRLLAGKLEYRMGLFPDAIGDFERLKFHDPSDALVEENLGLSLWGAKQMDRALASFGQLKTVGGNFGRRAEFYLGQIDLDAAKYQEAYDHFAQVGDAPLEGLEPARVQSGLAMAAQKLGKWDEAQKAWEAVLKATPGDAKAQAALREAARRAAAAKKAAERAAKQAADKAARAEKAAKKK